MASVRVSVSLVVAQRYTAWPAMLMPVSPSGMAMASCRPGTARIGSMLMKGLEGQITTAREV